MILGNAMLLAESSLDAMLAEAQTEFLNILTRLQSVPYRIDVRDKRLHSLLVPVAAGLGIQLHTPRRLPALDAARHALEARMG
jgi:hypothetical protein